MSEVLSEGEYSLIVSFFMLVKFSIELLLNTDGIKDAPMAVVETSFKNFLRVGFGI